MSLDLTKAPWPEWKEVKDIPAHNLTAQEYAFARHRVNLHEELVTLLEQIRNAGETMFPDVKLSLAQQARRIYVRRLLERARTKP